MIPVEQIAIIRRLFHAEHWKIGTIAIELGLHPDTVRRALETERFNRGPRKRQTLVEAYMVFVRQTLENHPRLRATRIYEMLRGKGYAWQRDPVAPGPGDPAPGSSRSVSATRYITRRADRKRIGLTSVRFA